MSDELKQELASVLRITEPGFAETHPRVIAEFQGTVLYTIEEQFSPGKMHYPYPGVDFYETTMPRLGRLNIAIDFSGSEQVTGTPQDFNHDADLFVGVELWKYLAQVEHGCDDDTPWFFSRYHRCAWSVDERGYLQMTSIRTTNSPMYALRYMQSDEYTPKMRGSNDE
jgi:hypothetical protein